MHATVTDEAEEMQVAVAPSQVANKIQQGRRPKELAALDILVNTRDVLINNASRADVHVADFAIAHLAIGKTDVEAAGSQGCRRVPPEHFGQIWCVGLRDGVRLAGFPQAVTVQNA